MIQKGSVEYMRLLTQKLHEQKLITTCVTCINFHHKMEMCLLCKLRPPAEVIANGCPAWQDEDLPF